MNTYLTIMVTVLVATQVIRITQNAINLKRQHDDIKRQLEWFDRNDVTEEDFKCQKEVFRLLRERLKNDAELD